MGQGGNMRVIVYDIDGTLSNNGHRQHFLSDPENRDWKNFNYNMAYDKPHDDIIFLMRTLHLFGTTNVITTGREECYRDVTLAWLHDQGLDNFFHKLYMRTNQDYRDDNLIKYEMLQQIIADFERPYMVFEDRDKCVRMWRENDIRCLQVNYGNF